MRSIILPLSLCLLSACVAVDAKAIKKRIPAGGLPDNFQGLAACEKQTMLWEEVQDTTYKKLPGFKKFGLFQLLGMSLQELQQKARRPSDVAPKGWRKYLHRHGALAKVKLVPKQTRFTGVFQGADCGFLRLSLTYRPGDDMPVAPGLALKLFRDGAPSANVSALVSLDGQAKDYNFFRHPLSNIVPIGGDTGQKLVHKLFKRVSPYPEELVLSDMAEVDARGARAGSALAPRQLFFVPAVGKDFAAEPHDVREDFRAIPEGSVVYKLYAAAEKYRSFDYTTYTKAQAEEFLKDAEHVADLVTTSPFVASKFGDDRLFFRHQVRD